MDSKSSGAAAYSTESGGHSGTTLTDAARMWPTPRSSDTNGAGAHGNGGMDLRTASGMWSTPRATDGEKGGPNQNFSAGGVPLASQAFHHAPTTPTAGADGLNAAGQRQLNPAFVEALMGFPPAWTACALSETPSSRSAPPSPSPSSQGG